MLNVKKLLSKVLNVFAHEKPNSYTYRNHINSERTTTGTLTLCSTDYTSNTGKIAIVGQAMLKTSTNTSKLSLNVNGVEEAITVTNSTTDIPLVVSHVMNVTKGASIPIKLDMVAQTSSVTATSRAYNTYGLTIVDIPTYMGG